MKKILLIFPLLILFSCSIQKRKYQGGYFVDWHNSKKKSIEKPDHLTKEAPKSDKISPEEEILVSTYPQNEEKKEAIASNMQIVKHPEIKKNISFYLPPEDSCDVLIFKDGSEIKGKVQEVGISEIKYKRFDTPDGPMYISRKSELFMIKYSNGTREVIKSEPAQEQVRTPAPPGAPSYRKQKFRREVHPLAIASLVLGIASVVLAYAMLLLIVPGFSFTIFLLPALAGLAALITGRTATRRIREQPDVYKGKGLAIPGIIMGSIIAGIFLTIFLLLLALG